MSQPRGWWFESGGEQCGFKQLVIITRLLLVYANVFTTTAAFYNFVDFVHVKYKKIKLAGIIDSAFSQYLEYHIKIRKVVWLIHVRSYTRYGSTDILEQRKLTLSSYTTQKS